jgi:hypothetical protein
MPGVANSGPTIGIPHATRVYPRQPLSNAGRLAWLLDNQFQVPGTSIRVGLDGILGLIPGIGDTLASCLSLFILSEAIQRKVRRRTIAKMAGNIAIDWVIGLVPLLGDVFDIVYKANMRNVALLEADLAARADGGGHRGARVVAVDDRVIVDHARA